MQIRRVDIQDTAEFQRYYDTMREAELAGRPDAPIYSAAELHALMAADIAVEVFDAYAGFEADKMVAAGLTYHSTVDNLDKADLFAAVPPALRRRGYGSQLLTALVDIAADQGRTTLLGEAMLPEGERETHPYRKFAEKHGFAVANIEIRRVLDLPIAAEQLDEWAAEAAPHHVDYRIETFDADVPDQLVPSLVDVMNRLGLDAPTGDIDLEARAMTPETYQAREDRNREAGKEVVRTLAIDATGETIGFTTIAVPLHERDVTYQYGTLVRADHRGHRLGMAMKVANLRAVQAAYPDRTHVDTCNAETNGPMVAINEKIGFRPVEVLAHFQRILTEPSPAPTRSPPRTTIKEPSR